MKARLVAALGDRYRIERELGRGGMAIVYLAEDVKHDRKVALKVLKPELAAVVGAERFLAEVKTTANLQHPHILPLFDSGEADGLVWYTMPYVEGESLRERLDRERQLPVGEAVAIAEKVAGALQAAHDRGIVHRDIKPANILLDARGEPLVSDFGIALAVQEAGGGRLTETGLSLGTPHYMSPEQATADRQVDARSDVYALGCVTHEMLAGEPPFTGTSAQAVLARILTEEPRDLTAMRRSVPPHVAAAVARALEKLPADRFDSAEAFGRALRDPNFRHGAGTVSASAGSGASTAAAPTKRPRWAHPAVTALLALLVLALGAVALSRSGESEASVAEAPLFTFAVPGGEDATALDVGPDGTLVWSTVDGRLLIRAPRSVQPRALDLPAGFGAQTLSFSPDGSRLAATAPGGELGVYTLATREWDVVVESGGAGGGGVAVVDWTEDGWLYGVYFDTDGAAVFRVRPSGGGREEIWRTAADAPITPYFLEALPDGAGVFLTAVQREPFEPHIIRIDPATGDTTTVVAGNAGQPRWSPSGHLFYISLDGGLWALPWDLDAREATGPAIRVIADLGTERAPRYGLGPGGMLAYVRGPSIDSEQVSALDEGGHYFSMVAPDGGVVPLPLEPTDHPDATLSPDGSRIAFTRENDILVFDLDIGREWPLTRDSTGHHDPVWSPDGEFVAYQDHERRIAVRRSDGTGEARVLPFFGDSIGPSPIQWLDDDRLLVLAEDPGPGDHDIVILPADGSAPPVPVLDGVWNESWAQVSPDGRWIGYLSDRSGVVSLYVRRWPELDRERAVSAEDPGVWASARFAWSRDGEELLFADGANRTLLAAAAESAASGEAALPRVVLPTGGRVQGPAPDGSTLLLTRGFDLRGYTAEEELRVITDWRVLLAERRAEAGG